MTSAEDVTPRIPVSREGWVDTARGIGIVLVVYGHALRSLFFSNTHTPQWVKISDSVIYTFHMPLFFLLAGLWIWPNIERGRYIFLKRKLSDIIYPYFIWSFIEGLIEFLFSPYVNTPITLYDIALIPVKPIEQFWFLYALFFAQLTLLVIYPRRYLLLFVGIVTFGISRFGLSPNGTILEFCTAVTYLTIGSISARSLKCLTAAHNLTVGFIGLASWTVFFVTFVVSGGDANGTLVPVGALSGIFGTTSVAILLTRFWRGGPLEFLGRASMVIYIMHTIASAALRIFLVKWGLPLESPFLLAAITVFGLIAPLAAWWLTAQLGLAKTLGLPLIPANLQRIAAQKHARL